jgi:hypothetical protein
LVQKTSYPSKWKEESVKISNSIIGKNFNGRVIIFLRSGKGMNSSEGHDERLQSDDGAASLFSFAPARFLKK